MTFRPETVSIDTWPAIFALLQPALEAGGDTTAHELIDDLLADRAQLWVLRGEGGDPKAAGVTERFGPVLHCHLLGGDDMGAWLDDLFAAVAAHAVPAGVERLTLEGRPGWERVLGARGWRKRAIVMERAL